MFLHDQRQHRSQRRADIAMHSQLERRPAPEPRRVVIDLHGPLSGKERVVGEVGAQQHQQVRFLRRLVVRTVTEQSAHPDVVRVVILDPLLAAQRVTDRALQLAGELHDLPVRVLYPRAAEQGHRSRCVEAVRERLDLLGRWRRSRSRRDEAAGAGGLGGVAMQHVAGDRQHCYFALPKRMLDGRADHPRHLPRLADQLAVAAAIDEHALRMCLLEEAGADLHARDVRGDRQQRSAGSVSVVETLDQVGIPRSTAAGTHSQASG